MANVADVVNVADAHSHLMPPLKPSERARAQQAEARVTVTLR